MRSAPTVAFDHRPSRSVAAAAAVISVAAILAPWLSALPSAARAGVSLAALIAAVAALRRFARSRFRRIAYQASGWKLVDAAGIEHAADIAAHARVGPWLALDFRVAGGHRFRALIGPDNVDADTRRRLVVLLSRAEIAQAG